MKNPALSFKIISVVLDSFAVSGLGRNEDRGKIWLWDILSK
jgi:hypothetical protein